MLKVLRIITRLNIGGPAIHTILLSSELNRDGYKDILVCGKVSESEGDMIYLARDKGVNPVVISHLGREISFARDLRALLALYSIIRKEKPDIIHTHTAKAGTLGRLAGILAGVPVKIHTFHGHVFDGYFNPGRARLFILIERFLALFTDKVITVSDTVKYDIVKNLKVASASKTAVIPLGLELEKYLNCDSLKGSFRKMLGVQDDALLVGIVGRLVPIKNHTMFLEAARNVLSKKQDKKVKFLIIGDGELKDHLVDHAKRLGLEKDVLFTGWINDLSSVYADLDIVVLTSLNEGTPVSIIEAMAAARSIVATDVGGVRDLIIDGENGLLVKENDIDGLSSKIAALLNDSGKRSLLGESGREHVKEKYSKERLVRDIKELYRTCRESKH